MGKSTLREFACIGLIPVSLSTGRAVSPGERFDLDPTEHDLRLVAAGEIAEVGEQVQLEDLKREVLDERAAALGIEDPASFKTKADIIDAITAREAAENGEDH